MPELFDIHDDTRGVIYNIIASERNVPSFAKSANIEVGPVGREGKQYFAWPEEKRFPVDDPSDLYWSSLYFEKTAHNIPAWKRAEIKEYLEELRDLSEMYIDPVEKTASLVPEIPIESFSIRIKAASLPVDFQTKFADYIYMDDWFVLYPLGTPEQVKEANALFPHGLNEELAYFRPFIAQDIISKLPETEMLNPKVEAYAPIEKSAAFSQFEERMYLAPQMSEHYDVLKEMLNLNPFPREKFANYLKLLDKQAGIDYLYNNHLMNPEEFLRGLTDQMDYKEAMLIPGQTVSSAVNKLKQKALVDAHHSAGEFRSVARASVGKNKPSNSRKLIEHNKFLDVRERAMQDASKLGMRSNQGILKRKEPIYTIGKNNTIGNSNWNS